MYGKKLILILGINNSYKNTTEECKNTYGLTDIKLSAGNVSTKWNWRFKELRKFSK